MIKDDLTALIDRHVDAAPEWRPSDREFRPPGPADAHLRESGVPIWALVAYASGVGGDRPRVAHDYEVSAEAVEAAFAFYERNRTLIDQRIARNTAA